MKGISVKDGRCRDEIRRCKLDSATTKQEELEIASLRPAADKNRLMMMNITVIIKVTTDAHEFYKRQQAILYSERRRSVDCYGKLAIPRR